MGKFNVTPEQLEQLKHEDSTDPVRIEGAAGQGKGTYHNPKTGHEIVSLMDPYHIMLRLRQGWRLGPASPELMEKWKIREAELRAEDDKRVEDYVAAHPQQEDQQNQFNDAVAQAAAAILQQVKEQGVALPDAGEGTTAPALVRQMAESGGIHSSPAPEGDQLSFDLPADAPSETEIKHVVSEASSPALHLVGHREET